MAQPDPRLCLTCGGPAVLCAASDRCVAEDVALLRPPRPNADVYRRTRSPLPVVFWAKLVFTVLMWLPVVRVLFRLDELVAPLLVFLGVPYAYCMARLTMVLWRAKNVGARSMPWLR